MWAMRAALVLALVATAGSRLLMVYPMQNNAKTGEVCMRVKVAHPDTARLSYHWVVVYTGFDADERVVDTFSVVA